MKRKTNYKNLISLALVLILLIAIAVPSSYALDTSKRRFGAWIMSAIQALNITMSSTLAPAQNMIDAIADPPGYVGIYEYPWEADWDDDILDRSVIQIWPDYTEIDGVKYTDVWLSHDAAEKFRVNAFDWKTAYNIASESQGTFASGVGYSANVPIYRVNNQLHSQIYTIEGMNNGQVGDVLITHAYNYDKSKKYITATYNGNSTTANQAISAAQNDYIYITPSSEFGSTATISNSTNGSYNMTINWPGGVNFLPYTSSPFEFDWVSGIIPADTPLPSNTGMMIRVPSDSPGLQTFIENNIEFTNEGGVELNFDLQPELKIAVDDLIDTLIPVIPFINTGDVQFTVNHEAPIPPIPDTPIVEATVPQVVNPIINEITNYGDQITQQIPNIIETIPTIDDICNNIDTAPYHDLDTGLDHLPTIFLPFITDLRSALGIWHYVTEWLSQISTTFAFVTGCLAGTAIMTPIYAGIAGFICIKVYRRMTG